MPLGEDATGNASRLRDKKNISWQYQMPCSLSVPEPLLVVDSLARQREFRAVGGILSEKRAGGLLTLPVALSFQDAGKTFRSGRRSCGAWTKHSE